MSRLEKAALGRRVRDLRVARGWTQGQLHARLLEHGVRIVQPHVSNLENGLCGITEDKVTALAAIFEVSERHLTSPGVEEELVAMQTIVELLEPLPVDARDRVLAWARARFKHWQPAAPPGLTEDRA